MNEHRIDPQQVRGWGVDADPENDPTYPMRTRHEGESHTRDWARPTQQTQAIEVLRSNERLDTAAVFGTSTPPSGVSGMLRRVAFRYSESSYGHWLPLMLADRVNEIEGVLTDLVHGHLPNVALEKGWSVEWKYNRAPLVRRVVVGSAAAAALFVGIAWLVKKRPDPRRDEAF